MSRKHRSRKPRRQSTQRVVPPITPAEYAAELEALAGQYPEEREELLIEAAGEWNVAGEYERALSVYERLLAEGCESPHLIESYRIGSLWDAGREEEARAAAGKLRTAHPHDGGAWNYVAETFETGGDLRAAAEWYTAGISHLLGTAAPLTVSDVQQGQFDAEMLVIGRHRVRRLAGDAHDDWDDLADALHESRPVAVRGAASLDELHGPERLGAFDSDDPEALRAEFERLSAEVAQRKAALFAPAVVCVVFWPPQEFTELLGRWPSFADDYGQEHAAHLRQVETVVRTLSEEGEPRLAVAPGSVAGFVTFTESEGLPPESEGLRAEYAADLAARGLGTAWPPPRNGPCWCGSSRKYKKCCGNPALA
ncbi:SEC-C metal-binding domain-containing protein [Streptomyces sp. H10-C2]|uniref:SEC-C metal-binding domain-containing protein n=1 Tax=unclassified Streptomyces TaxID=2593676 RepID=UPI0024B8F0E5|nr:MULTISPECIES: SEC-C metal-binding domain-containing protein [unclassified Streptomyces]MDJ0345470.1 SEC-C metal-binding domain-containing protein [Streptomyces sp. PH10-H1]MDJ0374266.1 SEC-C metal-binding domain-containing protein [Streptomyces sp. H10-C2]